MFHLLAASPSGCSRQFGVDWNQHPSTQSTPLHCVGWGSIWPYLQISKLPSGGHRRRMALNILWYPAHVSVSGLGNLELDHWTISKVDLTILSKSGCINQGLQVRKHHEQKKKEKEKKFKSYIPAIPPAECSASKYLVCVLSDRSGGFLLALCGPPLISALRVLKSHQQIKQDSSLYNLPTDK